MSREGKENLSKNISEHSVGARIGYLRQKRGITQVDLAKMAKLSQSTIAQIESDKKDPSLKSLTMISKALEIHISILFADEDVHVFDIRKLRRKYKKVDDLNDTLYRGIGEVVRFAKDIGYC